MATKKNVTTKKAAVKKTGAAKREAKGLPPVKAKKAAPAKAKKAAPKKEETPVVAAPAARETKKAVAIAMLTTGATVVEIMERLGWLRHTTRSFISVLGKTQKVNVALTDNKERKYTLA